MELALRIALITASANQDRGVTREGMAAAIEFCEWQEAVRLKYRPSEADDRDGKCQEAVIRALEPWRDDFQSWRQLCLRNNLYRHTAARLQRIYKAMVGEGMIEEERLIKEDGSEGKKTGRVKLVV